MKQANTSTRRDLLAASAASLLAAATVGLLFPAPVLAQQDSHPASKDMKLRFAFADQTFTATLSDAPAARELVSMLPLDLSIEDYSTNE